jgi:hypothetical protein
MNVPLISLLGNSFPPPHIFVREREDRIDINDVIITLSLHDDKESSKSNSSLRSSPASSSIQSLPLDLKKRQETIITRNDEQCDEVVSNLAALISSKQTENNEGIIRVKFHRKLQVYEKEDVSSIVLPAKDQNNRKSFCSFLLRKEKTDRKIVKFRRNHGSFCL